MNRIVTQGFKNKDLIRSRYLEKTGVLLLINKINKSMRLKVVNKSKETSNPRKFTDLEFNSSLITRNSLNC